MINLEGCELLLELEALISFQETVKFISRLIRILHSPHECGHTMIIANGFPGLPLSVVKVSAYICGFNLYQIYPSFMALGEKYTIRHFQSDIINAYTTAGLKVSSINSYVQN